MRGVPWCDANGVSLYYELSGTGDRLLVISGTGGDLRHQPRLTDGPLVESFEVLSYDQRGLGQSSVPPWPYAMADFADDAAALLHAVGWEDCLVLGISFGGMVAQELAIRHPLTCASARPGLHLGRRRGGASYPLHELVDQSPEDRVAAPDGADGHSMGRGLAGDAPRHGDADRRAHGARGAGDGAAGPGLASQLAARAEHDTAARLGRITCPTLVCGGRFDGIAPPANSEFLAEAIPGVALAMFDGGHAFLVQDRGAVKAVVAFLGVEA